MNPFDNPQIQNTQPTIQQPTMQQHIIEENPFVENTITQQPVIQQPVMQQPVTTEVPIQQPVMQQPVTTEVPIQQPIMQQPVTTEVPIQQPIMQQPVTTEVPIQQPIMQQPVTTEVPIQQSTTVEIVQPVQQNNFAQPTQTATPAPTLEPGQSIICQLQPGYFDAFIKVLSILDDKNIINISNSQICQSINNGTAILMTDISKLVGNKSINLHILNPKKYIGLFKAIKGNNDVFIIDDPARSQFIIRSGTTRLWLPKQIEELQVDSAPILDGIVSVGQTVKISKEERNKIMMLMRDQKYIIQLMHQNQLKGYMISETLEDSFLQYSSEEINENNADLKLMAYSFLTIPSDGDTEINIGFLNGQYWMNSIIKTAIVEILIFEALSPVQDDMLLI